MKHYYKFAITFVFVGMIVSGCDRPSPDEIQQRQHLPEQGLTGDVVLGKQLYEANCARCHGVKGSGTDQGPPLAHQVYRPGHHADLMFHMAVKSGSRQHHWHFGDMPPITGVTPKEVEHIVAYVRQEQRRAGIQ